MEPEAPLPREHGCKSQRSSTAREPYGVTERSAPGGMERGEQQTPSTLRQAVDLGLSREARVRR